MKEQRNYYSDGKFKTIGFPVSHKENEKRRAIMPDHVSGINHPDRLFFEEGHGLVLEIPNKEYARYGCIIAPRRRSLSRMLFVTRKLGMLTIWKACIRGKPFSAGFMRRRTETSQTRLSTAG